MIFTVIGVAILAIGGFWLFGGVVLRVAGAVFVIAGLISLITLANPVALLMVVIGLAMWLAGHWHFAVRHHEYKSPLARRIFLQVLPPRYDPTRHWATPVVAEVSERERGVVPESPTQGDDSAWRGSVVGEGRGGSRRSSRPTQRLD